MNRGLLLSIALMAVCACGPSKSARPASSALSLEGTIPLPDTKGRIDHLAYDPARRLLFVAELGNDSVDVVDLASGKRITRITGLHHPQGLAWLERSRELAVATDDGMVHFYKGDRFELATTLKVGDDADNLRADQRTGNVIVGYGGGALAIVDCKTHALLKRLPLPAHPEGFRLDGDIVWINLPGDGSIVRADLSSGKIVVRWPTGLHRLNFPMAFDPGSRTLAVAYRLPARLVLVDPLTGANRQVLGTCGDSDDLFFDRTGVQLFALCGSGEIDVYQRKALGYVLTDRMATRPGARTGLYVSQEDRLYVAARGQDRQSAAIMVFKAIH
ncbi:YncE family protein [Sphingobium sp. EM0848]|uniref:YncE family protein n=1 Tax=Sphingobium sp. EM0848 TaxID=2743473 RepID=UPI00159C7474|nr:WD40 repeat domain-containing protein [Sphingobium sp. EM0848]